MTISQLQTIVDSYAEKGRDVSFFCRIRVQNGKAVIEHWQIEVPRAEAGVSVRRQGGDQ